MTDYKLLPTHAEVGSKSHCEQEAEEANERCASLMNLLELAWGVIANAGGGDWTKETKDWQGAAARWRDYWHRVSVSKVIPAALAGATPKPPMVFVPAFELTKEQIEALRNGAPAVFQWVPDPTPLPSDIREKVREALERFLGKGGRDWRNPYQMASEALALLDSAPQEPTAATVGWTLAAEMERMASPDQRDETWNQAIEAAAETASEYCGCDGSDPQDTDACSYCLVVADVRALARKKGGAK